MTRGHHLTLILALSALPLSAAPISRETHAIVMLIAEASGVPRSVANQLQIEESGDWHTGTWGDPCAVGPIGADGYRSRGLYGISMKWQAYLVSLYYPHAPAYFDWSNPCDSAVVGLGYLSALHKRFGTWELALYFYNCGRVVDVPEDTKSYARRIIEARKP